jgi:hypothetical protein
MADPRVAGNAWTSAGTSTVQSVTASVSEVTLFAANINRLGGTLYNDTDKNCYVKLGSGATTTSFSFVLAKKDADGFGGFVSLGDMRLYTGIITGIWDAAPTGAMRITELT